MNYQLFHTITFNVLYGSIGLLVFVILERGIYLSYLGWRLQRLTAINNMEGGPGFHNRKEPWRKARSSSLLSPVGHLAGCEDRTTSGPRNQQHVDLIGVSSSG